MGLGQSQQVSLGRQDLPEPVAERRAQIAGLAGLLGDDQNRHRAQPELNLLLLQRGKEEYPGPGLAKPTEGDPLRCRQITTAPACGNAATEGRFVGLPLGRATCSFG